MPLNWPTSKLRDLADVRVSNVDKKSYAAERPIRLCNYMDVYANDYLTSALIDFMPATASPSEIERFALHAGDVVITKDSETPDDIGVPAVMVEDIDGLVCGYHLALIRPKASVHPTFLAKQLASAHTIRYFAAHATGSTRFGLAIGTIEKLDVPNPPIAEQSKIAEVLSTVDRAIKQSETLIAKQQRIKTGLMQDLLTRGIDEYGNLRSEKTHKFKDSPLGRIPVEWDARPLSEVVDLRVGYAFKRAWFADEGVRLLRGENVGTGSADWKNTQWLPSEMADKYPEYMLAEGDIVIGMDRTFTKQGCKVTILGESDVPCLLVQRVGCFLPVRISSDYMQMVIQSPQYQRELLLQQKGMDIPHLSKGEILSPLIPIPKAVEEMESIAGCAKALRTALTNESTHLNTLRLIKTGLMQDLLTGDRRVTALLRSPKEMVGA